MPPVTLGSQAAAVVGTGQTKGSTTDDRYGPLTGQLVDATGVAARLTAEIAAELAGALCSTQTSRQHVPTNCRETVAAGHWSCAG